MKKIILTLFLLSSYIANSQTLALFGIDESDFPRIKAKFFALDENWQQINNFSTSDLILKEDGIVKTITSISCPEQKLQDTLSSVLVMDVSGSMGWSRGNITNMDLAKKAAEIWVKALPTGSECAITSFDYLNYLNQDFTQNKSLLYSAIDNLIPWGGTNYDAALIEKMAGGLLISKNGKHKRVIVLLTDGAPNETPSVNKIVNEAKAQNCIIYCVSLGMRSHKSLIDIATQTGGEVFDNIATIEEAEAVYLNILREAQGNSPCSIEWDSDVVCKSEAKNVELSLNKYSLSTKLTYLIPKITIPRLTFTPRIATFNNPIPGETYEQKVIVSANNSDFTITDIFGDNPAFTISPKQFELKVGESIELTISYTAIDSSNAICKFELENNLCPTYLYANGGWRGKMPKEPTLKLTHPNGGEKFVVGSDTLITWEGILPSDTVMLEYSYDNGQTWNLITNKASDFEFKWTNIPKPTSNQCLVQVSQVDYKNYSDTNNTGPAIIWESAYGGSKYDYANSIIEISDGSYVVVGYTDSGDGDIKSTNKGWYDAWIIKLDQNNGDIIWEKNYGGSGLDRANSVIEAIDGYLYVAGNTSSNNEDIQSGNKGDSDYWIIKIDPSDGEIIWEKTYGGRFEDIANSIIETSDGKLVVAGFSLSDDQDVQSGNKGNYDCWLIKIDPKDGKLIWEKSFGGSEDDQATSIVETKDKNLIFSGWTESKDGDIKSGNKGHTDYWVVKINGENADIIWEKTYGGSLAELSYSTIQATDGSIFVAGSTSSPDGDVQSGINIGVEFWLLKLSDVNGDLIWEKTYGGSLAENANSIIQTRDGKLILAGWTQSHDGDVKSGNKGIEDCWLVKVAPENGELVWEKTFGSSRYDRAFSIIETRDKNIAVTGYINSIGGDVRKRYKGYIDYWVFKITGDETILQSDISDSLFAIVAPEAKSKDIDMKQELVGTLKDSIITNFIQNIGSWDFTVNSIYFEGADADVFSLVSGIPKYTVETNYNYFAEIRFAPTEARIFNAVVVIITQSDTLKINIRGEGVEPRLDVINKIIDFGIVELGEQKDTIQVTTIKNISSSPITIKEAKHNLPNIIDFSTLAGGGNFTLLPNETHQMNLRFKPSNLGRTSGTLEFYYDGISSPAIIQLFGEAINTKPLIQCNFNPFSDLTCEDNIINQLEIKNIGASNLIISSINITGVDASDFSINQAMPITILPNGIHILDINFAPNSAGQKTAELEILSNSEVDSSYIIPLSVRKDLINFSTQNSIDLGTLCPDESKVFEIEVANLSTIESYIDISTDSNLTTQTNNIRFGINQKDNIEFEFTGINQAGAFERKVSIQDSCGNIQIVSIIGIIEKPNIKFENLDLVTYIGTSKQQNIEIKNNYYKSITINNIDGILPPFSIIGNPFPLELDANSSEFITIEFNPIDDNTISQELRAEIEPCSYVEIFEITGISTDARIRLKAVETSAFAGDEISIPIILDLVENLNISGVTSVNFDLVFNSTLLAPLEYTSNIISDSLAFISLYDIPLNEINGSTLLKIKFIAGLGNAEFCDLRLSKLKLNGGTAEITTIDGKFNLLGICDEGGTRLINPMGNDYVLNISPNPSDGNVEISVNLLEEGSKLLKIYDYNGVLIEEFDLSNELGKINLSLNSKNYASGLYFVHLQTATIIKREKLIINR